jgi:hypothetical protein
LSGGRLPLCDDIESNDIVRMVAKLNMALRTLEVLGQLIKNFPGSLVGSDKFALVKECYLLGLRTVEMVLASLRDNAGDMVPSLVDKIKEHSPRLKDRDDIEVKVKHFLFWLVEGACFGMLKRISHAVGHSSLEATYQEVLDDLKTNSAKLIDMSIRLDSFDCAIDHLRDLKRDFKDNLFCDRLLAHLVVHYLYVFPSNEKTKQQICTELGIPIKRLRGYGCCVSGTEANRSSTLSRPVVEYHVGVILNRSGAASQLS